MNRSMHQDQVAIALLETLYGAGTPMRRAVIYDPEYPPGFSIGLLAHDIGHQPIKRLNAAFGLAAAKQFAPVYIHRGEVSPGAATTILMFHLHHRTGLCWQTGDHGERSKTDIATGESHPHEASAR